MKKVLTWLLLVSSFFFVIPRDAHASTLPMGFTETKIADGLQTPTSMAFSPDGRLFVNEKGGKIWIIKDEKLLTPAFLTLPVATDGEEGLLGITFDPDFERNHYIYVYYTTKNPTVHNKVSRFIVQSSNGNIADPDSETQIINLPTLGAAIHQGGAIHFGPDGKLYVAVGDNSVRDNSQSKDSLFGKILRVNPDGSIPEDNPFVGQSDAKGEIWALGFRNPYTFSFQPGTNKLFVNDVGENTFEEINDVTKGDNYGWPSCEGTCAISGMKNPLYFYDHNTGRAITGGDFYNSTNFPQEYQHDYFFADYTASWIKHFDIGKHEVTDFAINVPAAVDIKSGPDGGLYYLSISQGEVWRIQYGTNMITPTVSPTINPMISPTGGQMGATVALSVFLHGIGNGGDSVNPNNGGGNTSPVHQHLPVTIEVYNNNSEVIKTATGVIDYNPSEGDFKGNIDLGDLQSGPYQVKVKVPGYLNQMVPGIILINSTRAKELPAISLITGDVNRDNQVSVLDYNLIMDCFSVVEVARNCSDVTKKEKTDITDDGTVNEFDYNLFLRELTTHNGE
jgi:glucose/arabinose dehydrogenase